MRYRTQRLGLFANNSFHQLGIINLFVAADGFDSFQHVDNVLILLNIMQPSIGAYVNCKKTARMLRF